jgi:hypothetical protein
VLRILIGKSKWCWEYWISTSVRRDTRLHAINTKINSKWTESLTVRLKMMKILEDNLGEIFQDFEMDKDFRRKAPKA